MTVATDPRKTGIYAPATLLGASAVPVIIPSSGTSNATGLITHTTALPAQPTGTVLVFLPAGVVTAGSQGTGAGLYSVTYSTTAICQLTGTGIVTANAAYTQVLTEVVLATDTIPGGAMGLSGAVEAKFSLSVPNNANAKTPRVRFGGAAGTQYASPGLTTTASYSEIRRIRNRNSASSQVGSFAAGSTSGVGSSTANLPTSAVDTTAAVDLVYSGQLAVATDFLILEARETWLLP